MRIVRDIDILGDDEIRHLMLRWSFVFLVITIVAFCGASAAAWSGFLPAMGNLLLGCLGCIVALPVHELLHAAAFKVLGGRGCRISFGYGDGCLYTRTNDLILGRGRFVVVLLVPSVALTALLIALGLAAGSVAAGLLAAGLHLTGCTGDLAMVWVIAVTPGVTHVQDTEAGCRLLADS